MPHSIRIGALCWLLCAEFFVAQFIAQGAFAGYSLRDQDISMLGLLGCSSEVCSPLNAVFNIGIMINGALVLAGIWLTRHHWPATRWTTAALSLLFLGGLGTLAVGIFPLDANLPIHMLAAFLALCIACFGFMALGIATWRHHRLFAFYGLATGIVTLSAFLLYVSGHWLGLGRGTLERLAAWPQTIWYMVTGGLILLRALPNLRSAARS